MTLRCLRTPCRKNDSEDDEDTEIKTPEQEEEKVALVEEATIEEPLVETVSKSR